MSTNIIARLNGADLPPELALGRGLHYGDGVFRTLLRFEGRVLDAEGQIDKLLADAAAIGLRLDDDLRAQLEADLATGSADSPTAVVKLMLVRSGQGRGYAPPADNAERYVFVYPPPRYPESFWATGVAAERSAVVIGEQPALAGIKHLNRLEQVLACRAITADVQEVLLCDRHDHVVCGGRTNLFLVEAQTLCTPDLGASGVRGRMRDQVIALAQREGIPLLQETLTWSRVTGAGEAFVCNSLIGIWPLNRIAERHFDAPGPVTRRLMQALAHPRLS